MIMSMKRNVIMAWKKEMSKWKKEIMKVIRKKCQWNNGASAK